MAALIFDTCCFCFELRVGCLIIGYLNLIYSIITLVATLAVGLFVTTSKQGREALDDLSHKEGGAEFAAALSIIAVITVAVVLLLLIMNIVFLVGVHQNKRGHVKAYLIFNVIFLVLYAIMFFAGFAHSPINWQSIANMLFTLLLSTYFLLVIRSFYYKMNDTSRQPAIYNTA